jgi:hypothetical protein
VTKTELSLTPDEIARAKEIWAKYQREHDLSDRKGKAAGIDPTTGEVCLGESAIDIVQQRREKGLASPLFFERVGYPTYLRKGRRR